MNNRAIQEIGKHIGIFFTFTSKYPFFRKLKSEEIISHFDYKNFKKLCPEVCRLIEK